MSTEQMSRIVVGITGASGALYARRTLEVLTGAGVEVHLALTPFGRRLLHDELGMEGTGGVGTAGVGGVDLDALTKGRGDQVVLHRDRDVGAAIASGSFTHDGMIIVPCSSNTLGAVAAGTTANLVQRAAAVCLKERRRLVLGHREMPLSPIDIENMARLSRAGAIICPLAPGFYLLPQSLEDIVDFVVARLVDLVGVQHGLDVAWTGTIPEPVD